MTSEDLDVWGAPSTPEKAGRTVRERRWRRVPVRWLVIGVVAIGLGVWINSYAQLRQERDQLADSLAAARGEAGQASRLADQRLLESEFRSFDVLMLPEADGITGSLGVVNVVNSEGAPRTWLLLRARGADPNARYRLEIAPCGDGRGTDFPPFSSQHTAAGDGDLEMTAQNLDVPTDVNGVVVTIHDPGGRPIIGVLGPLVRPRRMAAGSTAGSLCRAT